MNEFIKKLIERLEERKQLHKDMIAYEHKNGTVTEEYQARKAVNVLDNAIEIVNQLAEEYNNESVKGDLISRSALKEEYDKLPIQATAEVKCDDGVYRNRPLVDLALVCKMIENVPTACNDGWIPVSSGKLPEAEEEVLICDDMNNLYIGYLSNVGFYVNDGEGWIDKKYVIAWQPLPQPYQTKGE